MEELAIGTIGGIIASMIIGFFAVVYQKIISPKLEEIFYKKQINFSGEWEYIVADIDEQGNDCQRVCSLDIVQRGFKVTGTYIINNKFADGSNILSQYDVTGIVASQMVTAYYLPRTNKRGGAGTLLLREGVAGRELKGTNSGVSVETGKIKTRTEVVFNRKDY